MRDSCRHLFAREFCRFAKRHDACDILRAGAAFSFLVTADILNRETHTPPNVKSADTFRGVQLVRRHRQQITPNIVDTDRETSGSLNCIRVKPEMSLAIRSLVTDKLTDVMHWLNRSDLVVGPHQRDKYCVWPKRGAQVGNSDDAVLINGQARDF